MPTVEVRVVRSVDLDAISRDAIGRFLSKAMLAVHTSVDGRAPVDTGNLKGSLQPGNVTALHMEENPPYAVVGTAEKYGRCLNDPVTRSPHYRGTSRAGEPTAGWFDLGVQDATGEVRSLAESIILPAIEAAWRSA